MFLFYFFYHGTTQVHSYIVWSYQMIRFTSDQITCIYNGEGSFEFCFFFVFYPQKNWKAPPRQPDASQKEQQIMRHDPMINTFFFFWLISLLYKNCISTRYCIASHTATPIRILETHNSFFAFTNWRSFPSIQAIQWVQLANLENKTWREGEKS